MILMALKPKPRPKDIPVGNVKRKSGAITESIRPKTLEKRPRELAKEFGDLEYRADLDTQLSWNPISRLGFDPDVHKIIKPPTAFYAQKAGPGVKEELIKQGYSPQDAEKIKTDRVITGSDLSVPPVISHEFTHRGFNILRNKMNQDPEAFEEKYGKQARKILKFTSKGDLKSDFEEYYVELFDDLDTRFNSSSLRAAGAGGEYESFPRDDLRRTVQSSKIGPNFPLDADIPEKYRDTRIRQIKTFQNNVEKYRKKGKLGGLAQGINQDINNGILGLMDAAQDILTEQGEPPKAKRKSLSFFEKLGKMIGFNKGGSIMNEQMQMAFMNEGGLKDDGMEKDPVSGNEVPSGSMAKEVRDDIPAQLSEGEYVVPADVVRYYGVKFFEDLRERAKIGLQEMEMNGRIGGEPVPAGGPINTEELSPEEMQAIQEMMGMSEGGSINALKTQQELLEQPPAKAQGNPVMMADGGEVKGYSPGGLEQSFLDTGQQAVNRGFVGFPLGSTIFPSEKTGQTALGPAGTQVATTKAIDTAITGTAGTDTSILTTVTLYGPNGEIVTLTLPTDQARYDQLISEGYTTEMPVAGEPVVKGGGNGGGDKVTSDGNAWMDKFDYTGDFSTNNLAQQTSDTLKKAPVGGVIGAFINGSNAAQAAANIIILEENGGDPTEIAKLKAEYQKFIKDTNLSYLPKELINGDALAKDIVRNNIDIALDRESVDVNGEPIFKDDDEFNKLMQDVSSEGMEFDPVSRSYKRKKRRDIGEILRGKKVETTPAGVNVYQATKDTPRPVARPTPPTEPIYTYTASDLANAKAVDDGLAAKATEDMIEQQREAARKAASDRRKDKRKANRDRTRNKLSAKDRVKNYKSGGQKFRGQGGRAEGGLMSKGKKK